MRLARALAMAAAPEVTKRHRYTTALTFVTGNAKKLEVGQPRL